MQETIARKLLRFQLNDIVILLLDLIAIPDFGAGAMENWGLITYRETSLLYSQDETSVQAKQWIGVVVAHELAHQWFGNLVTMLWWNDLWLNEGFASFMEYRGVDHIQPDWKMRDQFFVDVVNPALELDSLTTSHPVSVEVKDPKVFVIVIFGSYFYQPKIVNVVNGILMQSCFIALNFRKSKPFLTQYHTKR